MRPRCEHGHLWFDRESSARDCRTEVCPACGLVRLTSCHTGQVAGYAGMRSRRRRIGEALGYAPIATHNLWRPFRRVIQLGVYELWALIRSPSDLTTRRSALP